MSVINDKDTDECITQELPVSVDDVIYMILTYLTCI